MAGIRERSQQQGGGTQTQEPVRNVATYRVPISALLEGKPVRIVATGDMPGHSPVCQFVDEQGKIDWEEEGKFIVIDPQFLPASQQSLIEIGRAIDRSAKGSYSGR